MHIVSMKVLTILTGLGMASAIVLSPSGGSIISGGSVTAIDGQNTDNVTDPGASDDNNDALQLGAYPNGWRIEPGSSPNPLPQTIASRFVLMTAADLATRELSQQMPPQIFLYPDDPTLILTVQAEEVRYVLWGLFGTFDYLTNRPTFTEGGGEMYIGDRHVGTVVLHRRRGVRDTTNQTQSLSAKDVLSSTGPISAASEGIAVSSNVTVGTDNNSNNNTTSSLGVDDLNIRARYDSDIVIGQGNLFLALFDAIIGVAFVQTFRQSEDFVIENRDFSTRIIIGPSQPPRRRRPFNTRYDSIRVLGRMAQWAAETAIVGNWRELSCDGYKGNSAISYTTVKKWGPPWDVAAS